MGDGGVGGNGISDAQAAEFAASQEGIGLGTLGLTAGELAGVTAGGVVGAYSMGNANVAPEGGGGVEKLPEPRAWEAAIENAAEKGEQKAAITRKKRRRTLLTPEEGGVMQGSYPVYRRSILGI